MLTRLDAKQKERWLKTVNSIDFTQSSRLAWKTTGNDPKSRLQRLKNGMSQGSVFASLLFNIYTYYPPDLSAISRKFAYGNDLAIMHSARDWFLLKETLRQDPATISNYIKKRN